MKQFEYVEDAKLCKPKTPSKWKCFPEYTLITKVRMTCGGGLGGASWYEYVYRLDEIPTNKIIEVKRYDGKMIRLNTAYVVSTEDFKLAKATLDITEWAELSRGYIGPNEEEYYVLIDDDKELDLQLYQSNKLDLL